MSATRVEGGGGNVSGDGIWYSNGTYKPVEKPNVVHSSAWDKQQSGQHNHAGWYRTQKESIFDEGDVIVARNIRSKNSRVKPGDVGIVDKVHKSGYITCIFHEWVNGNAIEISQLFHEDHINYKWGGLNAAQI